MPTSQGSVVQGRDDTIFGVRAPKLVLEPPRCTDEALVAQYQNISALKKILYTEIYRASGNCTDENKRHLLCELEDRVYRTLDLAMVVKNGTPFFIL
jgi:hypothetical protein